MENNELNNELFIEFSKQELNVAKIKKLVDNGADINAVNSIDENLLVSVISNIDLSDKIPRLKLILELGADINFTMEGFNCLFDAYMTYDFEVVEFLFKAGAKPNFISVDSGDTVLDWIYTDLLIEESNLRDGWYQDINKQKENIKKLEKMTKLFRKYGAKTVSEIKKD